jgi:hypothetical protein
MKRLELPTKKPRWPLSPRRLLYTAPIKREDLSEEYLPFQQLKVAALTRCSFLRKIAFD